MKRKGENKKNKKWKNQPEHIINSKLYILIYDYMFICVYEYLYSFIYTYSFIWILWYAYILLWVYSNIEIFVYANIPTTGRPSDAILGRNSIQIRLLVGIGPDELLVEVRYQSGWRLGIAWDRIVWRRNCDNTDRFQPEGRTRYGLLLR